MRAAESAPLLDEARARGAERCARGQRAALDEVEDDARAVAELGDVAPRATRRPPGQALQVAPRVVERVRALVKSRLLGVGDVVEVLVEERAAERRSVHASAFMAP